MSVVIAPDARRCPRLNANGAVCGTILNQYNPGPDCLCHQRQPKGERGDIRRIGPTFNEVLLREYGVIPLPTDYKEQAAKVTPPEIIHPGVAA